MQTKIKCGWIGLARSFIALSLVLIVGCEGLLGTKPIVVDETIAAEQTPMSADTSSEQIAAEEDNQQPSEMETLDCDCDSEANKVALEASQSCPVSPAPAITAARPSHLGDELLVIGRVENVWLLPDKIKFKARIDTGAGLSSMHAIDLVEFERDGKRWVRFSVPASATKMIQYEQPVKRYVSIKQHTGTPQRRPIVTMSILLGSVEERVDFTLTNRKDYLYRILIGRNFLRDTAIVDVSRKFITVPLAP